MSGRVIQERMTIPARDYNDTFYRRQLERRLKRFERARKKEHAKQIAYYGFCSIALASLWIVMTGIWG